MIGADIIAACTGARAAAAALYAPFLDAAMTEFEITTVARQAAFLAQIGHESGGLQWTRELWGPTVAQKRYEPPGDKAEELGNTLPGDGRRFCGRGLIQITGRANYRAAGNALGSDLEAFPDLLLQPGMACRSAAWFWRSRGLNALADDALFTTITRRINGGTNGLPQRQALWVQAKVALGAPVRQGDQIIFASAATPPKAA